MKFSNKKKMWKISQKQNFPCSEHSMKILFALNIYILFSIAKILSSLNSFPLFIVSFFLLSNWRKIQSVLVVILRKNHVENFFWFDMENRENFWMLVETVLNWNILCGFNFWIEILWNFTELMILRVFKSIFLSKKFFAGIKIQNFKIRENLQ